jgi:hypothetical protein
MQLKQDKYKRARGGHSRLLEIACSQCNTHICYYQKDGPGILKRMYLDRIHGPRTTSSQLVCSKCKSLLGVKYTYAKEKRLAYRLFVGAISKKIISAKSQI